MNEEKRPDPDALLRAINAEEEKKSRGRLRIFFGGCAGVGKTYAMLNAAHQLKNEGVNVVVGLVETHGRGDTVRMVEGLPAVPPKETNHRGVIISEFDIDETIRRRPRLVLLDELAHTNAPGSRHPKRWMDVEELLDEGIDVFTTLNVQHLESLNDIVSGITGVQVKETVPDKIFDHADDISLIDIPADELLKRLSEGKVYIAQQAKDRAAQNFFKKSNIIALRELALRRTAERVDEQMIAYQTQVGGKTGGVTAVGKIMVCIGPDPNLSSKLVRTAKRLATGLKVNWTVVYVENERHYKLSKKAQVSIERIIHLAESMGASSEIIQGQNAMETILDYGHKNNFSKIILGKPRRSAFRDFVRGSLADELIRKSGNIDIYVVSADATNAKKDTGKAISHLNFKDHFTSYIAALLTPVFSTIICQYLQHFMNDINIAMVYVLGVVVASTFISRIPSIICSILSVVLFRFFFVDPLYHINFEDLEFIVAILVISTIAIIIFNKTNLLTLQLNYSRGRERNTSFLYAITKELSAVRGHRNMSMVAQKHMDEVFSGVSVVWIRGENNSLRLVNDIGDFKIEPREEGAAKWCFDHAQPAGMGSSTLPGAKGVFVPMKGSEKVIGVLGVIKKEGDENTDFSSDALELLGAFSGLLTAAFERANNADVAEKSRVETEMEKFRNRVFETVSDDLKTPIHTISDSVNKLLELAKWDRKYDEVKNTLKIVSDEAQRLNRIIHNMAEFRDVDSGKVRLNCQMFFIEEIIGSALLRCEKRLLNFEIKTEIEDGLPLVNLDGLLIEQVIISFLENASRRSEQGQIITIASRQIGSEIVVYVIDYGKKVQVEEVESTLNNKDHPGISTPADYTFLAVAKEVIESHGGKVWIENIHSSGVKFCFSIPMLTTVSTR